MGRCIKLRYQYIITLLNSTSQIEGEEPEYADSPDRPLYNECLERSMTVSCALKNTFYFDTKTPEQEQQRSTTVMRYAHPVLCIVEARMSVLFDHGYLFVLSESKTRLWPLCPGGQGLSVAEGACCLYLYICTVHGGTQTQKL